MVKPLSNPHIEAFLQLGTNIPCQPTNSNSISNICTNITQTNWCPQSSNEKLRIMLKDKKTWQVSIYLLQNMEYLCFFECT